VAIRKAVVDRGETLSLADALILASAETIGAEQLHSYDKDLTQLDGKGIVTFPIHPPPSPPQPKLPIKTSP